MGTGRQRALSPASLFIFLLSVARYRRHALALAAPLALLPAPGSSAGRRGLLRAPVEPGWPWEEDTSPSAPAADTRVLSVQPAGTRGKAATLQLALEAAPWLLLPLLLCLARPGAGARGGRGWSGSGLEPPRRGLNSPPSLPKVPGLGTVTCAVPTRSGALLVIAAVLEGEPAPPLPFPAGSPAPRQAMEPLLSFLSPRRQPSLKPLRRRGEETGERNSSSPGKQKPCLHQTAFGSPAQAAVV